MNEENKSKILIGSLVAIITLVIAVVGATYAFFSLNVSGDTTNTNVDIETGNADVVTIEQGAENIHINLAVSDMAENNPNKAYYATDTDDNYKLTVEEGTLTFATITGTNKEASDCTAKVTITMDTSDDSMGKVLQKGDAILYITSGKTEETVDLYDLLTEELSTSVTKEIEVELSVSEDNSSTIQGYLKVNNTESDQSYLAGKTLNITITVDNLACGVSKVGPTIGYIIANSTSGTLDTKNELKIRNEELTSAGVAEEDLDTLRRFVGTTTEVTDNYICFGTNDLKTCKDNLDQYMYRIIGIDDASDQIKLIKATKVVKGTQYNFQWDSTFDEVIKWDQSEIYKAINGQTLSVNSETACKECFVGNSYYSYMKEDTWTNLMVTNLTLYVGKDRTELDSTVPKITYTNERKEKVESGDPIGLVYLSDYLYAGLQDTTNWLLLSNGLNGTLNTGSPNSGVLQEVRAEKEWTMTIHGPAASDSNGGVIYADGWANFSLYKWDFAIRPTFYLDATKITLLGKGTMETPYYITNVG